MTEKDRHYLQVWKIYDGRGDLMAKWICEDCGKAGESYGNVTRRRCPPCDLDNLYAIVKKDAVEKSHCNDRLCEDETKYIEQLEMIIANSDPDGLPEDIGTLKARETWERLHKKYYPANYV